MIRDERLRADHERLEALARTSGGAIEIVTIRNNPPDLYEVRFRCKGIERLAAGRPVYRSEHQARIELPAKYPGKPRDAWPTARMLTPLFHPHVYSSGLVCVGASAVSEYLDDFVLRMGAMVQFDPSIIDEESPANREAMDWFRSHRSLVPVDTCTFRPQKPVPTGQGAISWQDRG